MRSKLTVSAVAVVVVTIVAIIGWYLLAGGGGVSVQLITKNPAEMMPTPPAGATVFTNDYLSADNFASVPEMTAWGYENGYALFWSGPSENEVVAISASRFSSIDGAKSAFNRLAFQEGTEVTEISHSTIGDESRLIYGTTPTAMPYYFIAFRKTNVVVTGNFINGAQAEAINYAQIVEGKIT